MIAFVLQNIRLVDFQKFLAKRLLIHMICIFTAYDMVLLFSFKSILSLLEDLEDFVSFGLS